MSVKFDRKIMLIICYINEEINSLMILNYKIYIINIFILCLEHIPIYKESQDTSYNL